MEEEKEENKKEVVRIAKRTFVNRLTEIYLWLIIAMLVAGRPIYYAFRNRNIMDTEYFLSFYNEILIAIFVFLFPLIFKQIFSKLPLEYIRTKKQQGQEVQISGSDNTIIINDNNSVEIKDESLFQKYANESKDISDKIYARSGVYLLIGCLIAFTGVAIFYSPIFGQIKSEGKEISQILIEYIPRFGALFFIEFVALFFLKQYRIMMQEYRYYEEIKRKRQNQYSIIEIVKKHKEEPDLINQLLESFDLSNVDTSKISSGETTEMLELEKITQKDLDIMGKLTEFLKEIKK
jgi:hypothetical protein